jgi:hypothetical protein
MPPPVTPPQPQPLSFKCFDRKQYSKQYYAQNKERILQYQKEYYHKKRKPKQKPHFEVRHGSYWLFGKKWGILSTT